MGGGELSKPLRKAFLHNSPKIGRRLQHGPKDGGWFISLTEESFKALMAEYLRPITNKICSVNNYEYIIAGLPVLQADQKDSIDAQGLLEEIRSQLSKKDNALMEFLLDGWDSEKLGEDFYLKAAASNNDFVRDYFEYDLGLRNAKVSYLNKALGRPEGQDIMILPHDSTKYEEIKDFEDAAKAVEVLGQNDILGRKGAWMIYYGQR